MSSNSIRKDYYAILQIARCASSEEVVKSYKRLALLKHPDKHNGAVWATEAFQALGEAYATLKDPDLRRDYDRTYSSSHATGNFTATPNAHPDAPFTQDYDEQIRKLEKEALELQERLRELDRSRRTAASDQAESEKPVTKLQAELGRFKKQDEEDARTNRDSQSWATFFQARLLGPREEHSPESREKREVARLERLAATRIKEQELARALRNLEGKKTTVKWIDRTILEEKVKLQSNTFRQNTIRDDQERARRAEQERKEQLRRAEEWRKRQEEFEVRQREEQARRAEQERKEQLRRAEESRKRQAEFEVRQREEQVRREARLQREREEEARREAINRELRETEERARRLRQELAGGFGHAGHSHHRDRPGTNRPGTNPQASCSHSYKWDYIDEPGICESCRKKQARFVFRCPGCSIQACIQCRNILRSGS